jgi:hypothetical protein
LDEPRTYCIEHRIEEIPVGALTLEEGQGHAARMPFVSGVEGEGARKDYSNMSATNAIARVVDLRVRRRLGLM